VWILATAALLAAIGSVPASARSNFVSGGLRFQDVTGVSCTSSVGLCRTGKFGEPLTGRFTLTGTALQATADTATTSVSWYSADMTITSRRGTITCKDTGVLRTVGLKPMTSFCVITGGTGRYANASGMLRFYTSYTTPGAGKGSYKGTVTL
jgi:hypothetical protein